MNWQEYIVADPRILAGKPTVKGTRLSVEFLLGLLAKGWTEEQIFESYPHLTREAFRAVFAFSAEAMRDEAYFALDAAQA